MSKTIVLAALFATSLVGTAHAGVITTSGQGFVSHSFTVANQSTNWTRDILFPKFDSSLGYIYRVTFDLVGSITSNITGVANGPDNGPEPVTATASAVFRIGSPFTAPMNLTASENRTQQVNGGGTSFDFGSIQASAQNVFNIEMGNPGFFDFVGADSYTVNLSATATSSVSGSGNILSSVISNAGSVLKVSYLYEPSNQVSVPASGLLMVLGVGLLGLFRRQTKA